jgi:hypothetical protein
MSTTILFTTQAMSHDEEKLFFGDHSKALKDCIVDFGIHNPMEMNSEEFAYGTSRDSKIPYRLNCGLIQSLAKVGYARTIQPRS